MSSTSPPLPDFPALPEELSDSHEQPSSSSGSQQRSEASFADEPPSHPDPFDARLSPSNDGSTSVASRWQQPKPKRARLEDELSTFSAFPEMPPAPEPSQSASARRPAALPSLSSSSSPSPSSFLFPSMDDEDEPLLNLQPTAKRRTPSPSLLSLGLQTQPSQPQQYLKEQRPAKVGEEDHWEERKGGWGESEEKEPPEPAEPAEAAELSQHSNEVSNTRQHSSAFDAFPRFSGAAQSSTPPAPSAPRFSPPAAPASSAQRAAPPVSQPSIDLTDEDEPLFPNEVFRTSPPAAASVAPPLAAQRPAPPSSVPFYTPFSTSSVSSGPLHPSFGQSFSHSLPDSSSSFPSSSPFASQPPTAARPPPAAPSQFSSLIEPSAPPLPRRPLHTAEAPVVDLTDDMEEGEFKLEYKQPPQQRPQPSQQQQQRTQSTSSSSFAPQRFPASSTSSTFTPGLPFSQPFQSSSSSSSSSSLPSHVKEQKEEIDLLDSDAEDDAADIKFGTLLAFVRPPNASVQLHINQPLMAVHEPAVDDQWRMRVMTDDEEDVGFLNREASVALAPLLLERKVVVDVKVHAVLPGQIIVRIALSGDAAFKQEVEFKIRSTNSIHYFDASIADRYFDSTFASQQLTAGASSSSSSPYAVNPYMPLPPGPSQADVESNLDLLFSEDGLDAAASLETDTSSLVVPQALQTPLHGYQRQGLLWMQRREETRIQWKKPRVDVKRRVDPFTGRVLVDDDEVEVWLSWEKRTDRRGRITFHNRAKNKMQMHEPDFVRGGILADDMGLGKCFAAGTRLWLYSGETVPVEDITGGEQLMGDDGSPRIVTPGSLTRGRSLLYRITPAWSGAEPFTVNSEHILVLRISARPSLRYRPDKLQWTVTVFQLDTVSNVMQCTERYCSSEEEAEQELRTLRQQWKPLEWEVSVNDFLAAPASVRAACRLFQSGPVTFHSSTRPRLQRVLSELLPLPPTDAQLRWAAWYLGLWLQRGVSGAASLCDPHSDVFERLMDYQQLFGESVLRTADHRVMFGSSSTGGLACRLLSAYGLLSAQQKSLPPALLCDTLDVRRQVLAGAIDGCDCERAVSASDDAYDLLMADRDVAAGCKLLAASLGIRNGAVSRCSSGKSGDLHGLRLSGAMHTVPQHCATRSFNLCASAADSSKLDAEDSRSYGFGVEAQAEGDYFGFAVSGVNRRFLLADFTVTHNTLQMIGLIAAGLERGERGPTLVVCPLSVVSNWRQQVEAHVRPHYQLRVIVYHGPDRLKDPDKLEQFDVVITTYNIISSEWVEEEKEEKERDANGEIVKRKKGKDEEKERDHWPTAASRSRAALSSPLFAIRWLRICLDEAHNIRERATRQSRACRALDGDCRWAMTGTPFQNRIDDGFALFHFLRVEPFTSHYYWQKLILAPFKTRDQAGVQRLQRLMACLCLRRRKTDKQQDGQPILVLPGKGVRYINVELNVEEKHLYNILETSATRAFRVLLNSGEALAQYAVVLEMLLRLRQCCDHITLVPQSYYRNGFGLTNSQLDETRRLVTLLADSSNEPCASCRRAIDDEDAAIVPCCAEIYHQTCIDAMLQSAQHLVMQQQPQHQQQQHAARCVCGVVLKRDKVVTSDMKSVLSAEDSRQALTSSLSASSGSLLSSKMVVLLSELRSCVACSDKAVVFSQWTSFLDLLGPALKQQNMRFVRLDGQMNGQQRAAAIQAFQTNPDVQVFLVSLKAGGVGLNLTAANRVYLTDIWWNPAAEDQAVDRVHRLGQTKAVDVVKLIVKGTVEQRVLDLQEKKREMTSAAMGRVGRSREQEKEERLQNLKTLFNVE